MKTLLLNPQPQRDVVISRDHMGGFGFEIKSNNLTPPLTLAYCASVMESIGLSVEILDAVALGWKPDTALAWIREHGFGFVAVNTATPSIRDDLSIADSIKESQPETVVTLLGPHVSIFAEDALRESRADAVVRGEPEYALSELADAVLRHKPREGIQGLSVRDGNRILHFADRPPIENLDSLPFPARHLLPMSRYRSAVWGKRPFTTMLSSRGCFYGCSYCPYRIAHGTTWRSRSPENVVDEIEQCVRKFGVREILFRDPLFTADQERALRICELIVNRGIEVDWRCETRADLVSEELVKWFARAGCKEINFGIESANTDVLKGVKRTPIPFARVRSIFEACRKNGIETMAFFIIGLPGETEDTVKQTVELAIELNPDVVQFTAATPYPDTPYYEQLKQDGLLVEDWSLFTSRAPVVGTRALSPDKLCALIGHAYRRFYFRPSYALRRARKLRSPHEAVRLWKGLWSAVKYAGLIR
ncbi:MAG: radical SAM protein [Candidatus Abyssubacteria bacterium]